MIVSYDLSSSDLIGAMNNGVIGQVPPGNENVMTSSYAIRYLPSQGANDSLLYDLSGKKKCYNQWKYCCKWKNNYLYSNSCNSLVRFRNYIRKCNRALPVLDPVVLNNYRPDQGIHCYYLPKMYIPSIPATGSTKTIFGSQGTNGSSQNNGIRFVIECQDHPVYPELFL